MGELYARRRSFSSPAKKLALRESCRRQATERVLLTFS
jgi:hypothetical protein